jgi:hypothetical protein
MRWRRIGYLIIKPITRSLKSKRLAFHKSHFPLSEERSCVTAGEASADGINDISRAFCTLSRHKMMLDALIIHHSSTARSLNAVRASYDRPQSRLCKKSSTFLLTSSGTWSMGQCPAFSSTTKLSTQGNEANGSARARGSQRSSAPQRILTGTGHRESRSSGKGPELDSRHRQATKVQEPRGVDDVCVCRALLHSTQHLGLTSRQT